MIIHLSEYDLNAGIPAVTVEMQLYHNKITMGAVTVSRLSFPMIQCEVQDVSKDDITTVTCLGSSG